MRNPDIQDSTGYDFSFQMLDSNMAKILQESFKSYDNYLLDPFTYDPAQNYLFYYDEFTATPITEINLI
jgi:hypothetical protein